MFSSGLRPHGCMWEGWVCGGEGEVGGRGRWGGGGGGGEGEGEGEGECPI